MKSFPKFLLMVLAFAGDSTMMSDLPLSGASLTVFLRVFLRGVLFFVLSVVAFSLLILSTLLVNRVAVVEQPI